MAEAVQLRDCGTWLSGGTPSTEVPAFWNGGIPWITSSSLRGRYLSKSARRLTSAGVASGSRLVPPGTLLFVVRGMSLKSEFRVGLTMREVAFGQDCKALVPRDGVDPRYLLFALEAAEPHILKLVDEASHGTGRLQTSLLSALQIRLPPLDEQRRIAEMLDTIDDAIRSTERIIVKHRLLRRSVVSDLFERGTSDSPVDGWRVATVGSFANVQRGASPRPIDNPHWFSDTGPGWVRISDVTAADGVLTKTTDHLSKSGAARSRRLAPGAVIVSIAATIGLAAIVGIDACIHDGFVHVDHDDTVSAEFLVLTLQHHRPHLLRSGQTGTQSNVNSTIVSQLSVRVPSRDVQRSIVAAARDVDGALRSEVSTLGKLRATRAGLAADLLSGRVRTAAP